MTIVQSDLHSCRQAKPDPNRSGFLLPFCRDFARHFKHCPLRWQTNICQTVIAMEKVC